MKTSFFNRIVLSFIGIASMCYLACYYGCKKSDDMRINNEMIYQLEKINIRHNLDAWLYMNPSMDNSRIPVPLELCEAIMRIYGRSAGNSDASKAIKNHDVLYLKIANRIDNEYCVAKLHVNKDAGLIRIFPVANHQYFRIALLGQNNDNDALLIRSELNKFTEQIRPRANQ